VNSLRRIGILLVVMPLLALAACKPDPSHASTSGSAPATSPSKSASLESDAEAFTECVREHGVSDFPRGHCALGRSAAIELKRVVRPDLGRL